MTDPDPFFGPLFFRAMSLVHLRPAEMHLSQGSVLEHFTLRFRHASQGRRDSGVAGPAPLSSMDSAIHETLDCKEAAAQAPEFEDRSTNAVVISLSVRTKLCQLPCACPC